jgi:hypothetical protein
MDASQLGLDLIPPDGDPVSPEEDLAAAVAGALDAPAEATEDAPVAFGRTWAFDYEAGRFVREGGRPRPVAGLDAFEVWCGMAVRVARFAHPIFSAGFGMDEPENVIGEAANTLEVFGDWGDRLREALLVHDRAQGVEDYDARWDMNEGEVSATWRVVTDAGDVRFDDLILGSFTA